MRKVQLRGEVSMHYPALDGLRGLAAYVVIVGHFSNLTNVFGGILGFGSGQLGVMLFFVISGFLMGRLYMEEEWSFHAVLDFYRKRVARVIPLFLAVVLLSYATVALFGPPGVLYNIDEKKLFEHLFFIQGTSVLWTIPVEVQFYAVFPLIWLAFKYAGKSIVIWLGLCSALAFALDWSYPVLMGCISFFLAGIAISLLPLGNGGRRADISFLVCLVAFFLSFPRIAGAHPSEVWQSPTYLILMPALVASAVHSPAANRILGSPFARFLGDSSYSAYLLHWPLLRAMLKLPVITVEKHVFLVIYLLATMLVSYLSLLLLERPARRFISGRNVRRSAVPRQAESAPAPTELGRQPASR